MARSNVETSPVWVNTRHPSPAQKPPTSQTGVIGWLRANLFSSIFNSILTILSLILIYYFFTGIFEWVFFEAFWRPVWVNRKLLAVGTYPMAQLWQPAILLAVISLLFGLSGGRWGGIMRSVSIGVAALLLVLAILPVGIGAQIYLGVSFALLAGGYVIGLRLPIPHRLLVIAWLLSIPFALIMLKGGIELRTFGLSTFFARPVQASNYGGLLLTMLLAVVGITFSFPLGLGLALGRRSSLPVVKYFCIAYIEMIRGVPLISILFMAMIVLPLFLPLGMPSPTNVTRAMVGITLFSAAYLAENVRGGLQSVPKGQYEAADALGLSTWNKYRMIILPQALRAVIPAIVGQFIALFKDTSLVALVGLVDLLGIARSIIQQPDWVNTPGGITREVYVSIAVIYFIFSYGMSWSSRQLEARLGVGKR
ncbi:MAG: amino acid ABC transporter permease [Caldilineaceae bacterium]|nr:amino acid ABC transporter permease [Caldilineaceae bacterium]